MTDQFTTYADTEAMRIQSRAASILTSLVTPDRSRVDSFHDLTVDQCEDVVRWADAEAEPPREACPTLAGVGSMFARMFAEVRA